GQHVHRTAVGLGPREGVGVHRHEQVGLRAARDGYTLVQRHEVVAVACEYGLHVGFGVDLALEAARDRQRYVLLVRAAAADGARVFAAMTGVDDDGEHAVFRRGSLPVFAGRDAFSASLARRGGQWRA